MILERKPYAKMVESLFTLTPDKQIEHQRLLAEESGLKKGTAITVFVKQGNKISYEVVLV